MIGDRIEAGDTALTVTKIERKKAISDFQKAGDGEIYVIAEVVIEAVGDKAPYNPLYFKAKDADGFEYSSELLTGGQSLKSGDLAKGEKARGEVGFKVKEAAKGLVLNYEPLSLLSTTPIRVSLDQ